MIVGFLFTTRVVAKDSPIVVKKNVVAQMSYVSAG
jgi:hypothetical protein